MKIVTHIKSGIYDYRAIILDLYEKKYHLDFILHSWQRLETNNINIYQIQALIGMFQLILFPYC